MKSAVKINMSQLTDLVDRVNEKTVSELDWPIITELVNRYYDAQKRKWERNIELLNSDSQTSVDDKSEEKNPSYTDKLPDTNLKHHQSGGHGKTSLYKYKPAEIIEHRIAGFKNGQACSECTGKIYQDRPRKILRFVGDATLKSEIHHIHQARCRCCGMRLIANYPVKLDENVAGFEYQACSALLVLHYFGGTPFKRMEMLQNWMGTKISDSKLWEVVEAVIELLNPVYNEHERSALNTSVSVRYDDTGTNINYKESSTRSVNASVFYFECQDKKFVLYFTGFHHAGEVMDVLLEKRDPDLPKLISTCDAASKNFTHNHKDEVISSVCNTHAYRKFKDIKDNYPDEFEYVKKIYGMVYDNDSYCKERFFSDKARLAYHQDNSGPLMHNLNNWAKEKIKAESIDLNSGIAEAVTYLSNQWVKLTEFLRTPGVPLDTNLAEQMVKTIIRYRNNSRSYKNTNGATTGDRIMSLGQSIIANGKSPFEYFLWCLQHRQDLEKNPIRYTPLKYIENSS